MAAETHQKRLWQSMIDLIQEYLDGKTDDFNSIVGKLEGSLDASEIKNKELVNQWYDYWVPLEIQRATCENHDNVDKAKDMLSAMKQFLQRRICDL